MSASATAITQLRFTTRSETVAEKLREALLSGALRPGQRLVEQELAHRFGIGQTTLREALKDLENEGFVRKTPKRGTYITELTREDFRNILDVRMLLEAVAIERAAPRITAPALRQLAGTVKAMQAAARRLELAAFHKHDLAFHRLIWNFAGNDYLSATLERVAFGLFAFVLLQRQTDSGDGFLAAAEQHQQILSGLRSGDPSAAREAFIRATLQFWKEHHDVEVAVSTIH